MENKEYRIRVKQPKGWKIGLYDYTLEEAKKAKLNIEIAAKNLGVKTKVEIFKFNDDTSFQ
jgi:hypothetical protein